MGRVIVPAIVLAGLSLWGVLFVQHGPTIIHWIATGEVAP